MSVLLMMPANTPLTCVLFVHETNSASGNLNVIVMFKLNVPSIRIPFRRGLPFVASITAIVSMIDFPTLNNASALMLAGIFGKAFYLCQFFG
jgi:hypothetical protein